MIKETLYFMLASFAMILLYKILIPVYISFSNPFTAVSNSTITDPTFRAGLLTLPGNINIAIQYTFVGIIIIIGVYLAIVAIKKEGEEYK